MHQDHPQLCQATWRIGRGHNIPISHPAWFKIKPTAPHSLQNQVTTIADLINHQNASWKTDLISQLYEQQDSAQILSIIMPVVESNDTPDKLIWPYSLNGEYQVQKAYEILTHHACANGPPSSIHTQPNIWKLLWKLKLPHKILTFTWKLLHHAIPVKAELNRTGVHCAMNCLMCNNACETQDHIFLYCDLARAVWFGADIPITHITQADITMDSWVKDLIKQHNDSEHSNSNLHKILTLLWCIWFHRNQIMFEGKQPNPMEIILTSTSLLNRFLQSFSNNAGITSGVRHPALASTWTHDVNWQALITTAGGKSQNCTR
jgi:hypothetical protein